MTMLRNRLRHAGFVGKRGPSYNPMVDVAPLDPQHKRLQGMIDGGGQLDGQLSVIQHLVGTLDGDGELYGHLWPPLLLKGKVEGGGALAGTLYASVRLQGAIDGGGEGYGNLSLVAPITEPTQIGDTDTGFSGSTFSVFTDAGTQIGDLLILVVGTTGNVPSAPSGFTLMNPPGSTALGSEPSGTRISVFTALADVAGVDEIVIADVGTMQCALITTFRGTDLAQYVSGGQVALAAAGSEITTSSSTIAFADDELGMFIGASRGSISNVQFVDTTGSQWADMTLVSVTTGGTGQPNVAVGMARPVASGTLTTPKFTWTGSATNRIGETRVLRSLD